MTGPAGGPAKADEPTPPGGKTVPEMRELIDRMRSRVEASGKLLGALATAAATTLGVAKVTDLTPVSDGDRPLAIVAVLLLVLGVVGVLWITFRLTRVSRPLAMTTDLDEMVRAEEIEERERRLVQSLYDETARLNGARSLASYEWQMRSLRRTAGWLGNGPADTAERERRERTADGIAEDLHQVFGRGAVVIVRDRSMRAVVNSRTMLASLLVVVGFVGFSLLADQIASEQPAVELAFVERCADARRAGATRTELEKLDGDCSTERDPVPTVVDPVADARACGEARTAGATSGELTQAGCVGEETATEITVSQESRAGRDGRFRQAWRRTFSFDGQGVPAVVAMLQMAGAALGVG